jgi:hypothetical protein
MTPKGFIRVLSYNGVLRYFNVDHIIQYFPNHNETFIQTSEETYLVSMTCEEVGKLIEEANGVGK